MALPTVERNWIFTRNGGAVSTLNQAMAAQVDVNTQKAYMLWLLKDTLVNFSSGPWTVIESKNSAGTFGNADYWPDYITALCSGGPSGTAWIVLQNIFAGRQAQILIYMSGYGNGIDGYIFISTGTLFPISGSATVPTVPSDALRWDYLYSSGTVIHRILPYTFPVGAYVLNVMQTWDVIQGVESLRFSVYGSGSRYTWGFWDKLKEVPTGGGITWAYPEVAIFGPNDNYAPTWNDMSYYRASHFVYGALPGTITNMGAYFTTESIVPANTPIPFVNAGIPNDLSGTYHISKLGLICDLYPMLGKIANLVDFWLGSNAIAEASYYPSGAPQFYQIGNFIWPWDGSTVPVTT